MIRGWDLIPSPTGLARDIFWKTLPPYTADTRRWINAGLTSVHRLRRWTSVKPTLIQRLVSAGSLRMGRDNRSRWGTYSAAPPTPSSPCFHWQGELRRLYGFIKWIIFEIRKMIFLKPHSWNYHHGCSIRLFSLGAMTINLFLPTSLSSSVIYRAHLWNLWGVPPIFPTYVTQRV